jgi:hypothetical protein
VTFDLFSFLLGVAACYAAVELLGVPTLGHVLRLAHDRLR